MKFPIAVSPKIIEKPVRSCRKNVVFSMFFAVFSHFRFMPRDPMQWLIREITSPPWLFCIFQRLTVPISLSVESSYSATATVVVPRSTAADYTALVVCEMFILRYFCIFHTQVSAHTVNDGCYIVIIQMHGSLCNNIPGRSFTPRPKPRKFRHNQRNLALASDKII